MKSVGTFLQAEEDLKEEVERQKNNPFAKVWGKRPMILRLFLSLKRYENAGRNRKLHEIIQSARELLSVG